MGNRKKVKKKTRFRRAADQNMTRDQAMLKHKKERLAILKRRRRWLVTAIAGAVAAVVLLVVFLTGGFEKKASETTLTVKADGSITFEEVDVVNSSVSESEIVSYSKEAIAAYNEENKTGGAVKFKKCDVSDGVVYLKTVYKDAQTYADFTGLNFFAGTVEQAQKEGFSFNASFVTVSDGKKGKVAKAADVKADGTKKVVVLDQPVAVVVPSSVTCVSDEGTSVEAGDRIRIGNEVESYIIY
ncbi:MAG: hypothetical protein IJ682_03560 [Lachnospiraceae bacterium]|nr:hypothetical protein [Lachnospiraceae bacterium]